jgi:HSP20 family protein
MTAVFDLPDVRKEDVHVAFQFDRLTITWESTITTETRGPDRTVVRERKERKYARTLPLPANTSVSSPSTRMLSLNSITYTRCDILQQFEDVRAYLEDGRLTVTYPKYPRVYGQKALPPTY